MFFSVYLKQSFRRKTPPGVSAPSASLRPLNVSRVKCGGRPAGNTQWRDRAPPRHTGHDPFRTRPPASVINYNIILQSQLFQHVKVWYNDRIALYCAERFLRPPQDENQDTIQNEGDRCG